MRGRLLRELAVILQWQKRKFLRRFRMDMFTGVMGILSMLSGIALFFWITQSVAEFVRQVIPWVTGAGVGNFYWTSIFMALKFTALFMLFLVSCVLFFILKIYHKR